MANHNPERASTSPWPWIIGIIVVILLVIGLFALLSDDTETDQVAADEPTEVEVVEEVEEFGNWVQEEMPGYEPERQNHMAADGFDQLADAIEGVRESRDGQQQPGQQQPGQQQPGMQQPDQQQSGQQQSGQQQPGQQQQQPGQQQPGIEQDAMQTPTQGQRQTFDAQLDSIRANASNLRDDEDTTRHAEYARNAAMAAADVMSQLQQQRGMQQPGMQQPGGQQQPGMQQPGQQQPGQQQPRQQDEQQPGAQQPNQQQGDQELGQQQPGQGTGAAGSVQQVQAAAQNINPDVPLFELQPALQDFFQQAHNALRAMVPAGGTPAAPPTNDPAAPPAAPPTDQPGSQPDAPGTNEPGTAPPTGQPNT